MRLRLAAARRERNFPRVPAPADPGFEAIGTVRHAERAHATPRDMLREGTFKWQLFRFIEEDQERTQALRSGHDPEATGSIQGSATTNESVRRPGEAGRRSR